MPLEDAIKLVRDAGIDMLAIEDNLEKAKEARNELNREITNARRRLQRKKDGSAYPTKLANEIIKQLRQENLMVETLSTSLESALEDEGDSEFNEEEYKKALYEVVKSPDIYKIILVGTGWGIKPSVNIEFYEEAGDLNDWAEAIQFYRDYILGSSTEEEDGIKATQFFEEKVYGTALFSRTIKGRLSAYSKGKAPFWQLLNSGSVSLPSDRGGYNPLPQEPTDFIGTAETRIKSLFIGLFNPERTRWLQETTEFNGELQYAITVRDGFSDDIQKLKVEMKQNQNVINSLGKRKEYIDDEKLAKAAERLRAGEEFERVDITRAGSPVRVRPTRRQLARGLDLDY